MNQVIIDTKDNQKYIFNGKGIKVGFVFTCDAMKVTVSEAKATKINIFSADDIKKISITDLKENKVSCWADNKWNVKPLIQD